MICSIIVAIVIIGLFLWAKKRSKKLKVFEELSIPGPKPNIFCGNLWDIYTKNPLVAINEWKQKYGRIFGYYFGFKPILVVTDLELLKHVMVKDFHNFIDRGLLFTIKNRKDDPKKRIAPLNYHVGNATGNRWKELRSILTPGFTTRKMKLMTPLMNEAIDVFISKLKEKSTSNQTFDILPYYQALAVDIIGRCVFGVEIDSQEDINSELLKSSRVIFSNKMQSLILMISLSLPEFGNVAHLTVRIAQFFKNKGKDVMAELMAKSKMAIEMRKNNPSSKRPDLLQMMLDAEATNRTAEDIKEEELTAGDEEKEQLQEKINSENVIKNKKYMTDKDVLSNSMMFFLGGFETSSTSLANVTYLLAKYPDIQEKCRNEINEILKSKEVLDYESLSDMKYLEQVLQESWRLYPPVYLGVNRETIDDYKFKNITIPSEMVIQIPVHTINHDPEYWDNPEMFIPERFSQENRSQINSIAFQTFGFGPRNCMGMRFAQMELKLVLAKLLSQYQLRISSQSKPFETVIGTTNLSPRNGVFIQLTDTHS
jgi:thromboxane-A synthase